MRTLLPQVPIWRHDLTHCLHTTAGVILGAYGLDPLETLGAGWGFHYEAGDVRREEYYFPCHRGSLFASLAPHHVIESVWHTPVDAEQGWAQVRAAVAGGAPVAVAVDNFHLPFRPAFQDVHTNHLLAVVGFDDETRQVYVSDPVPPRFAGPIPISVLTEARGSTNPARHDRDLFFTDNPIGHRWLEVRIGSRQPVFDLPQVRLVVRSNVADLRADGLARLRSFLDGGYARLPDSVDEIFVVAGTVLAVTGLHAAYLDRAGTAFGELRLREIGRLVERVAHHWAALRIAIATARIDANKALPGLRARRDGLMASYARVLDDLEEWVAAGA